jgi:hypothetical protein
VPAQPVGATPSNLNLFSKGGVYDARETGEAFRDAEGRHATGNGQIHHEAFAMASGEMNEVEYATFLNTSLRLLARHSTPTVISFACIDWRHLADRVAAGRQIFDSVLNICVWVKNNAGMGPFYRSQHEFICVFRNGRGHHRNNVQLGKFGRNRTNVWQYPGVNTLSRQSEEGNLLPLHGCATRKWYLASFLFLWHCSERMYTCRLDTVQRGDRDA